jgi:hypothetical protein
VSLVDLKLSDESISLTKKLQSLSIESYTDSYRRLQNYKDEIQNANAMIGQKIEVVRLDNHKLVIEQLTKNLAA